MTIWMAVPGLLILGFNRAQVHGFSQGKAKSKIGICYVSSSKNYCVSLPGSNMFFRLLRGIVNICKELKRQIGLTIRLLWRS